MHTAATPQGSPNTTLELINSAHLSPKSALAISEHHVSETSLAADGNSPLHLVRLPVCHFLIKYSVSIYYILFGQLIRLRLVSLITSGSFHILSTNIIESVDTNI